MTMGSRRSSDGEATSADELQSRGSISLEFDDYPLDLVSPIARDYDDQDLPSSWQIPGNFDFGDQRDPFLTKYGDTKDPFLSDLEDSKDIYFTDETYKYIDERDRFITDEIITDYGNRRSCEYPQNGSLHPNGDVFISNYTNQFNDIIYPSATDSFREGETHYEKTNCCSAIRKWFRTKCKLCLAKYHSLPEQPMWYHRWRYALLCPPHGLLSHGTGLILIVLIIWGLLWTIDREGAQRGGGLFSIIVLLVFSFIAGALVEWIRLPPLLGMVLVGVLLKNVAAINMAKNIDPHLSAVLRELGVAFLLLRSGLVLTPTSLRQQAFAVLRLALFPCVAEIVTVGLCAKFILSLPWLWSFLLGMLMSAAGPVIINPCVLSLQTRGYGLDKAVSSLLVAATSVDNILPVTCVSVVLVILFNQDPLLMSIFRGPLEAMGGVLCAMVVGSVLWYIPHRQHPNVTLLRVLLLGGCGCLLALGSWSLQCTRVMPIGCMTLVFVTVTRWRKEHKQGDQAPVEDALKRLWCIYQPLFYGVLGTDIDLYDMDSSIVGLGIAVILLGTITRVIVAFLTMFRTTLNVKEKLFVALAWIPKASVQLSLGSLVLLTAQAAESQQNSIQHGQMVSSIATLTVLLTLPLGGALCSITAPFLLTRSDHLIRSDNSDSINTAWDGTMQHPELSKLKISEISNNTVEIEITAERETVT